MNCLLATFFCLLFLGTECFGQKRAEKWIFGNNGAGLDFSCAPPFAISGNTDYYSDEGCASICNDSGELLFYSEGMHVYNRNNIQMPNGFDMGIPNDCWGSTTQGCLIVPHPGQSDLYYLFTLDCAESGEYQEDQGFRYSIIDMSLDNGLGDVIEKAIPICGNVCEKLAAVYHSNGQDVWVVVHEYGSDVFRAYLVDETGLNMDPVLSHEGVIQVMYDDLPSCWGISSKRGYMKFSPNGDKLVVVSTSDCHPYTHPVQMFQFNDSTGELLLSYSLNDPDSIKYYGASFSPDGNLLYLSTGWYGFNTLQQFNVSIPDSVVVMNSKVSLYEWTEETQYLNCAMQIGPDGKIYVAEHTNYVGVIYNPNTIGTGCQYEHDYIFTAQCPMNTYSEFGMPNFIESYFQESYLGQSCNEYIEADFTYSGVEPGEPIQFTDNSSGYPIEPSIWQWDFDDPGSGVNNTSAMQNPVHIFNEPGMYQVALTVISDTTEWYDNTGIPCLSDSVSYFVTIELQEEKEELPVTPFRAWFDFNNLIIETTSSPFELMIHDPAGRLVLSSQGASVVPIDCTSLNNGLYFLSLKNGDQLSDVMKLVKSE